MNIKHLYLSLCLGMFLLSGCGFSVTSQPAGVEPTTRRVSMRQLLTELQKGVYWEGTAEYYFGDQYPDGVPEDYFSIIGQGAQANFQAIRLDGATLAIRMGSVANLDSPDSPPPPARLEILRRTDDGWSNITKRVLPSWALEFAPSRLNKDRSITVWSTKGERTIRFDGMRFH